MKPAYDVIPIPVMVCFLKAVMSWLPEDTISERTASIGELHDGGFTHSDCVKVLSRPVIERGKTLVLYEGKVYR